MRCIHLRVPVGMWTDLDHHFPCIVCIHNSRKPKSPLEPEIYSNIIREMLCLHCSLLCNQHFYFFRQTEWAHRYGNFTVTYIPSWWGDPGDNRNNSEVSAGNNNDVLTETINIYSGNFYITATFEKKIHRSATCCRRTPFAGEDGGHESIATL